jgi:formylglycine-generating enzyme required for sulfatase activity
MRRPSARPSRFSPARPRSRRIEHALGPSEAEWEKATRGTDGRHFPWNEWHPEYLYAANRVGYTTPAGRYPQGQSPHGILDAAGSVFEWTGTDFDDEKVVLKGCSWDDEGGICHAASRHGRLPETRHILIGFRCVCETQSEGG